MKMPMHEHEIPAPKIPTGRIETLTDGIFAIAMTLLVLSIEVPTLTGVVTPLVFRAYVTSILPQIFIYVISFILLAVFWMNHHIFYIIKHTNTTLLWINILWLMSIAIVPFSTSIIGKYGQFQLAQLIFDVNMLIIGLLWYANWYYASKKGFVVEKVMPYADQIKRSNLSLPILALMAITLFL
ncbi:MAG: TMEM175 family protein [Halobacteriota archaeon]